MLKQRLVEAIHAAPGQLVLAVTGGGSSAIAELLSVAGASRTLLEATIPYQEKSLRQYLNAAPEQLCSARTARSMAMVAWQRACQFGLVDQPVFGLGSTAAIATNRERRGEDRCHVAVQSFDATLELSVLLGKGLTRQVQEGICRDLILHAIAETLGLLNDHPPDIELTRRRHHASPAWQALLRGVPGHARTESAIRQSTPPNTQTNTQKIDTLFPGTFNPLHHGHIALLDVAGDILGTRVFPEISIRNVDKPPLDYLEMQDRQAALGDYEVIFSNAPTFEEKSRLFPGVTFVVGLDTILRVADPGYYGNDARLRDQAVLNIAARGNKFLVFGRLRQGQFETLGQVSLPNALRAICMEVSQAQCRVDVSSSELRREQ